MASERELRRRIRSISSTAQITKAMQMVAASKMRKAQQLAIEVRPFVRLLYRMQRAATTHAQDFNHPLTRVRPVRTRAVILVAADKGLCGSLNSNVFRLATPCDPSTVFITAGRKAAQFVAQTGRRLAAEFAYGDTPQFAESRAIAALARQLFEQGEVDAVDVIASRFVNTLTQEPMMLPLLPIGDISNLRIPGMAPRDSRTAPPDFVFEPDAADIVSYAIDIYIKVFIHVVLLNAKASEQSARMVSMQNATESATEMIRSLTLEYNKLRQGRITQQLLEIAGGTAA